MNICLQQNYLLLTYDHNIIYKWVRTNFPSNHRVTPLQIGRNKHNNKDSWLDKVLGGLCINFCAELCQMLAIVKLKDQNSSIGFNRVRLMLDQSQEQRGKIYWFRYCIQSHSFISLWWSMFVMYLYANFLYVTLWINIIIYYYYYLTRLVAQDGCKVFSIFMKAWNVDIKKKEYKFFHFWMEIIAEVRNKMFFKNYFF